MLINYLKIALRNLLKNRTYSFINIAGLSVGITCCMLITLWVYDEATYDNFIPKAERIYEVDLNMDYGGKINTWSSLPLALFDELKTANAGIARVAVTTWRAPRLLSVGEKRIVEHGYAASEEFLEMFEFKLLQGAATQVLDDPSGIVLTQSTASLLFGNEDAMGKIVRVDDKDELKVTGIVEDHPENSTFRFNYIVPFSYLERTQESVAQTRSRWDNYNFPMFVELSSNEHKTLVDNAIKDIVARHSNDGIKRELFLHGMTRWRLHMAFRDGAEDPDGGMIQYVKLFSVIAIFILAIACINFMNLATARSEKRAREVGIRKSIGSNRKDLVLQFLGESMIMATIAFALALLLTELALPFYNTMVSKQLAINYMSWVFWTFALAVIFITGLLSGSYPAFYLSSFRPAQVLKGIVKTGGGAIRSRQVLVVTQIGFAVLLIVGTIVVVRQINYIKARDLGYAQENLVAIPHNGDIPKNFAAIRTELLQSGAVESVTSSYGMITEVASNNFVGWPGKPEDLQVSFSTIPISYDYAQTMGIKVIEGRDFSLDFPSDSSAVIVNMAAIKLMGLENPIGQQLDFWNKKRTLVGVFDDVLMESPFEPVRPAIYILFPWWVSDITIRLSKTDDVQASMNTVEGVFKKYNPAYPFEYKFTDATYDSKFTHINLISRLVSIFSTLALIITGLGLFGLATFTAEQRTKEIGIRKVLGASVRSIVTLISKDFTAIVVVGFFVAAPIAWWLVNKLFLEQYTLKTDFPWWIIPAAGAGSLLFALLIVSMQALKAAKSNPVDSLRSE
jgi:predicted permease